VIPPGSQDGEVGFDAAGREEFRSAHGLQDKFVIMYSGNHSPVHPLDTLMRAADRLRGEKDIVFAFIGGGSEFTKVKKWAEGNPRILCLPYQPLARLSASLSAADMHVVVMGDKMLGLVHPCKIYNILMVGAPVVYIGPRSSHVTEIFAGLPDYPWISAQTGEGEILAERIRQRAVGLAAERLPLNDVLAAYSKRALMPKMIAVIEPGGKAGQA